MCVWCVFPPSPNSSQSCLYLSVMVVPCCLHSASRGSAMNCSVISVNILAPLESRIFSISLTYKEEKRRRRGGRLRTHLHTRVWFVQTDLWRINTHKHNTQFSQLTQNYTGHYTFKKGRPIFTLARVISISQVLHVYRQITANNPDWAKV